MPNLSNHQSNTFVKLLLMGNSKTGKTGSLVSLVKAGYKLRIIDLDNLLDILVRYIRKECPDEISDVEFVSVRDKIKTGPAGPCISGTPKAWAIATRLCDRWKYEDVDFGIPAEWGSGHILVIDSLSRLCDAAYDYHEAIIPRGRSGEYDGRAVYGNAQDAVEKFLAMLTSTGMQTNVIVIAHVQFQEQDDGKIKGFPQGIGQKLSPVIPQYFPNVVLYQQEGGRRVMKTNSTPLIDLCTADPFNTSPSYPIETGLADLFSVLLSTEPPTLPPTPIEEILGATANDLVDMQPKSRIGSEFRRI
jgi:hypothetical protein